MSKPKVYQLPLGPLQTNCYVLADPQTQQAAVIDPSWNGRGIAQMVADEGWQVDKILITHTHFDHVAGLAELKEATGAPIYAHADAVARIGSAARLAQMWQIHFPDPPPVDFTLAEGDTVSVGDLTLEVLFTPGHAPDHICFYLRDHALLFDGDVLFQQGIGRFDLPGGNYDVLMGSIREKLMTLPDATAVLPGHGATTTIGQERASNPYLEP